MNKLLILASWLLLTACQTAPENTVTTSQEEASFLQPKAMPDKNMAEADIPDEPLSPAPPEPTSRKLIRNAQLRFRVSQFAASGRAIEQAVRQAGGQITYANETRTGNTLENSLIVRVPGNRLDTFLTEALKQSIFTDTKTITTEDVTRRYVDVEARIRSKRATEETYLRLLKQARNVDDVLKVEEQLGQIREAREVQEAELRQLKNDVALSTVNLTYYEETEVVFRPEEPFYAQIAHNLTDGFRLVGNALVGVFYFLPLGVVIAFVVWLVLRWRRKRRA